MAEKNGRNQARTIRSAIDLPLLKNASTHPLHYGPQRREERTNAFFRLRLCKQLLQMPWCRNRGKRRGRHRGKTNNSFIRKKEPYLHQQKKAALAASTRQKKRGMYPFTAYVHTIKHRFWLARLLTETNFFQYIRQLPVIGIKKTACIFSYSCPCGMETTVPLLRPKCRWCIFFVEKGSMFGLPEPHPSAIGSHFGLRHTDGHRSWKAPVVYKTWTRQMEEKEGTWERCGKKWFAPNNISQLRSWDSLA